MLCKSLVMDVWTFVDEEVVKDFKFDKIPKD